MANYFENWYYNNRAPVWPTNQGWLHEVECLRSPKLERSQAQYADKRYLSGRCIVRNAAQRLARAEAARAEKSDKRRKSRSRPLKNSPMTIANTCTKRYKLPHREKSE
jgi:hypothetical protein